MNYKMFWYDYCIKANPHVSSHLYHSISICKNKDFHVCGHLVSHNIFTYTTKQQVCSATRKKNTIAAPVNICKLFLIYISQLRVAVTTQQHGVGCGWLTKWVALPLISSPCLLPKQSRSKLKQMYLPTLQADPQLRQTCTATPLFWALAYQISSCLYSHSKKR